jgi:hypothetical protein
MFEHPAAPVVPSLATSSPASAVDHEGNKRSRRVRPVLRGHVRGAAAAATYLGIDRKTFRNWRDDPEMARAELLRPRIIRGDTYYSLRKLDEFMDPENNPPGAAIEDHFLHAD